MKKYLHSVIVMVAVVMCNLIPQAIVAQPLNSNSSLTELIKGRQLLSRGIHKAPSGDVSVKKLPDIKDKPRQSGTRSGAPAKVSQHYGDIFGYMSYCDTPGFVPGVYAVKSEGVVRMWDDPVYSEKGYRMTTGWYAGGKVCGFAAEHAFGQLIGIYYVEIDFASGALEKCEPIDTSKGYFSIAAYSSADGYIYGYGINASGEVVWMKAPADNPSAVETVCKASVDVDICYSLCYQPLGDNFYGMTVAQQFVVIEKDGSVFTIREIPDGDSLSTYRSGLVYSPFDQCYYWNAISRSGESLFYEIALGGYMEVVDTFAGGEEFDFFFTTDVPLLPGQPDKPLLKEIIFEGNSLDGKGVYQMPLWAGGGEAISGEMGWTAMCDGYTCDTGTASAGEDVEVEYSCPVDGLHQLEFYVTLGDMESPHVVTSVYTGNDTPKAPANVVLTTGSVTWDAVTEGVHNGYLDTSVMYYVVYVDGYLKGYATNGTTHVDIEIGDGEYSAHVATVVAHCNSLKSEPGVSNQLVCGNPLDLPLKIVPTQAQFELLTVTDANVDGATWTYNEEEECLEASYSMFLPMDDWVFLPPVSLSSTERYYTFTMNANARSTRFSEEYIEVMAFRGAPSPAGDKVEVIGRFSPVLQKQKYTGVFKVPEAGTYYVGIHCVSAADMYGVQVRDISLVDNNVTVGSPAAVTGISATGAAEGVLTAEVTFTLPALTLGGEPLPDGTELGVTVEGAETAHFTAAAGTEVTYTVPTVQGVNTIYVYTTLNGCNSIPVEVEVFTGVDKPMTVENFRMETTEDMLGVVISWDPPAASVGGGYFDPSKVEYEIMVPVQQFFGVTWETIYNCGTECSFHLQLPEGAPMDIMEFGVLAVNAAGDCGSLVSSRALVGTPYNLPVEEDFENPDEPMKFEPWLTYDTGSDVYFGVIPTSELGLSGTAGAQVLYGYCADESGTGILGLPRFSTAGTDGAHVEIGLLCGEWVPEVTFLAQKHGDMAPVVIHTCDASGSGFRNITFNLPDEFIGQKWVQLYMQCNFRSASEVFVADYVNILDGKAAVATVDADYSDVAVTVEGNEIVVTGNICGMVEVYTPDGRKVASKAHTGSVSRVRAESGVYIVTAPSLTVKVVVK